MSAMLVWLVYIVLLWIVIGMPMGTLLGKMIKRADREERTFAGGVVARAFANAAADPPPSRYAAMDEHIGILGHDAVLQWLDPSIVDDFNGENERRREEAEAAEKRKAAKKAYYERRIAKSADPTQERRQITAEIMGYASGGPIRTVYEDEYIRERVATERAIANAYLGLHADRMHVEHRLAGNSDRW